jgi:hypothetical protein
MKKKLVGIFITMLLISSAMIVILFSDIAKVEASGEGQESGGSVNLDYDWVWERVQDFGNVIHNVDWSKNGENGRPKGRCWATAGENYTIDEILRPNMNGTDKPCGLSEYRETLIGPLQSNLTRQYSSKIVIKDYNLTIKNNSVLYRYLPYSELFPFGVGCGKVEDLNHKFNFSNVEIREKSLLNGEFIQDHHNVSCDLLNTYRYVVGLVVYLNTTDSVPENHDCIFLLNEEPASENKLQNLSDAMGCILIENNTKEYTFQNSSQYNFAIATLSGTDSNFSTVLSEIQSGSVYAVDNLQDNQTLVFSNYSNASCFPASDWMAVVQLTKESDYGVILYLCSMLWSIKLCHCAGIIISNYQPSLHYMSYTVRDWEWFHKDSILPGWYANKFALPVFSVNKTIGKYLIDNQDSVTVTGFVDQEYRQQTNDKPGVISHNVVAYRNITHSPNNAIAVLSNRIDGWWGEAPGDSGVGGAILLGIAKYFKDNNITPKYNLMFLFTTGEEYGMRGAQHYVDSHPNGTGAGEYNFIHYIGFDQLGFNFTLSKDEKQTLKIYTKNQTMADLLEVIADQTNYEQRTHGCYNFPSPIPQPGDGSEDYVWKDNCDDTVLIEKDSVWDGHHQTGMNFTKGDSLSNIDRNDVNVTFELAWNMTKYFTVNPDCWFSDVTFTPIDAQYDGDMLYDSIQTNFTIHSILLSDRVRVELELAYEVDGEGGYIQNAGRTDYTVTSGIQNCSYIFTIPDDVIEGYYSVSFKIYNSTGRINRIVYGQDDSYYNDSTETSEWYHLYHPLGYSKIGDIFKCADDNISGSVFTANENGKAENITAFINQKYNNPGPYTCMLYRASDGSLIGTTTSTWVSLPQPSGEESSTSWWAVFNFTGNKPYLVKGTQYVISCWGDSDSSWVYYDESSSSETGRYENHPYGAPPDPAEFTSEPRYYSLYCGYTSDDAPPQITNVTTTPHTVGFGCNVTITANVTDTCSGVGDVKVQIDHGYTISNSTMTHVSGIIYQYVFTDTWLARQYNYTIWATDNASNRGSSSGHHFHVSADATISIATLKDSYSGTEYINITDPPNPPENLTLVNRGLTWNTYYNASSGENILETFQGPVNYQEDNGTWTPINSTLNQLSSNHSAYVYGYRTGNNHGLYGVYFKPNAQSDWPVAFTYNRSADPTIHVIRSKLVGVGYVDPQSNWAYQYLQNVQSSQGQITDSAVMYPGAFTGTDVTWSYGNIGLKEEILLSNTTKTVLQNHPPSQYGLNDASSYLVFITKLEYQSLDVYNVSGILTGNVTITEKGAEFRDALGYFKCALPLGDAYELHNESVRQKLTYRIIHYNGYTFLLSGLKLSDVMGMVFPVVIDPTLTVYSSSNDGYIYTSNPNYYTGRNASTGTVGDSASTLYIGQRKFGSTYFQYRGFVLFNTTALPSNAYVDTAVVSLYKNSDYSSTDFSLTIQNGQPTYLHNPLQSTDYNKNDYSGNGGSFNTSGFGSGYNSINLNSDGRGWLNKTGWTKLCLRSNKDINGTAPSGNEFVIVYASEQGSGYQPKLVITYRNQSKIKNTGSADIKGFLHIQIQYYNIFQGWVLDNDVINETSPRTITSGNQLALDTIFNGHVRASDLAHGIGTYRVYVTFRDPDGNILKTDSGVELKAWWQFSKT